MQIVKKICLVEIFFSLQILLEKGIQKKFVPILWPLWGKKMDSYEAEQSVKEVFSGFQTPTFLLLIYPLNSL